LQSTSISPFTINVQLLERSHDFTSVFVLHITFDFSSSPLQQPTTVSVVTGFVVVISQSSGSSVTSHSHSFSSHLPCSIAI